MHRTVAIPVVLFNLAACGKSSSSQAIDAGSGEAGGATAETSGTGSVDGMDRGEDCSICEAAEARLGYRVCVCRIPDTALWTSITVSLVHDSRRNRTVGVAINLRILTRCRV